MKSIKNELFSKFESKGLTKVEQQKISGGVADGGPEHSDDTGDTQCTSSKGSDCTDPTTSALQDNELTLPDNDGCDNPL